MNDSQATYFRLQAAANEIAVKVTDEIVANVDRLRKLGAKKILVNNMPPLGCTPQSARYGNYTGCDEHGNIMASVHNNNLQQKLANDNTVRILDIHTAFTNIISGTSGMYTSAVIFSSL